MTQSSVTGMSCAACSARVEKAVSAVPGVTSCAVSLLTNSMGVDGTAAPADIVRAVENAARKNTVQILACFPAKRTVAVLKFVPSNYLYNNDCSRHFLNFQVSSKLYCALDSHIFSCMDSRRDQSRFAWLFPADNRRRKGKFTISNADKAVDALSRCRAKTADIYCITHSFILSIW